MKKKKSESNVVAKPKTTDSQLIDREVFDWGVRLTTRPFKQTEKQSIAICSEIDHYGAGRGGKVRITFPAASVKSPLRLVDAQAWCEAMRAIIAATRAVQAEMRTTTASKKKRKSQTARDKQARPRQWPPQT